MKKWLVYVLGIITGIILTFVFAYCVNMSNDLGIRGLELFDDPGEYMDFSKLEVFQVVESGCALSRADDYSTKVFLIPDDKQHFYDNQIIKLEDNQRLQRVGTFKYSNALGVENTVPAVIIVSGVNISGADDIESRKEMFDRPGECVSRNSFEVQEVLESGDAIASEVIFNYSGHIQTSDLTVMILAKKGSHFYNNQIVKAPKGKCARQIGTYKYGGGVIPIIAFK